MAVDRLAVDEERPPPGTTLADQFRNLRERSRVRAYLTVAALVLVVVGAFAIAWQRGEYGVWPGSDAAPEHLNHCGRSFSGGQTVTLPASTPLYRAYTFSPPLSAHHEVYSDMPIQTSPDVVCSMHLLMHLDGHHYATYTLEGGP